MSEQRNKTALLLRREIIASLIAVKPHLDAPYPDDPRWTPWTRFVERTLARVDELAKLVESGRECLQDIRAVLDAYPDDDGPGAALVALGKIGNRVYSEVTGV